LQNQFLHLVQIHRVDVETRSDLVHARITRRAKDFVDNLGLRNLPGQGVFAAARSDNKNFHARSYWTGLRSRSSPERPIKRATAVRDQSEGDACGGCS